MDKFNSAQRRLLPSVGLGSMIRRHLPVEFVRSSCQFEGYGLWNRIPEQPSALQDFQQTHTQAKLLMYAKHEIHKYRHTANTFFQMQIHQHRNLTAAIVKKSVIAHSRENAFKLT